MVKLHTFLRIHFILLWVITIPKLFGQQATTKTLKIQLDSAYSLENRGKYELAASKYKEISFLQYQKEKYHEAVLSLI